MFSNLTAATFVRDGSQSFHVGHSEGDDLLPGGGQRRSVSFSRAAILEGNPETASELWGLNRQEDDGRAVRRNQVRMLRGRTNPGKRREVV